MKPNVRLELTRPQAELIEEMMIDLLGPVDAPMREKRLANGILIALASAGVGVVELANGAVIGGEHGE